MGRSTEGQPSETVIKTGEAAGSHEVSQSSLHRSPHQAYEEHKQQQQFAKNTDTCLPAAIISYTSEHFVTRPVRNLGTQIAKAAYNPEDPDVIAAAKYGGKQAAFLMSAAKANTPEWLRLYASPLRSTINDLNECRQGNPTALTGRIIKTASALAFNDRSQLVTDITKDAGAIHSSMPLVGTVLAIPQMSKKIIVDFNPKNSLSQTFPAIGLIRSGIEKLTTTSGQAAVISEATMFFLPVPGQKLERLEELRHLAKGDRLANEDKVKEALSKLNDSGKDKIFARTLASENEKFTAKGPIEKKDTYAYKLKERIEQNDVKGTLDLVCPSMPTFTKSLLELAMKKAGIEHQANILPGLKGDVFTRQAITLAKEYSSDPKSFCALVAEVSKFPITELPARSKFLATTHSALESYQALAKSAEEDCFSKLAAANEQYYRQRWTNHQYQAVNNQYSAEFEATRKQIREQLAEKVDQAEHHYYNLVHQAQDEFFTEIAPLLHNNNGDNSKTFIHAIRLNFSSENLLNILRLVKTFGNQSEIWLAKQAERGNDFHDATYFLPLKPTSELKGLGEYLMANKGKNIGALGVVAKNWNKLSDVEKKLPFDQLLDSFSRRAYPNVKVPEFAREAAQWGLDEADYKRLEKLYSQSLTVPSPFPLAEIWKESGLVGKFLPRTDVRGMFLGEHTHCCQHPGGAGEMCALYGQASAYAGFFVVENEKTGQILAQSFAWVDTKGGMCFDNIEAIKLGAREEAVAKIYESAAKDLTQKNGFKTVTVGTQRSDVNVTRWSDAGNKKLAIPGAIGSVSDANNQVILSASQ